MFKNNLQKKFSQYSMRQISPKELSNIYKKLKNSGINLKWLDIWKKANRQRFIRKYDKIIIHEQSKKVKATMKDIKNPYKNLKKVKQDMTLRKQ